MKSVAYNQGARDACVDWTPSKIVTPLKKIEFNPPTQEIRIRSRVVISSQLVSDYLHLPQMPWPYRGISPTLEQLPCNAFLGSCAELGSIGWHTPAECTQSVPAVAHLAFGCCV